MMGKKEGEVDGSRTGFLYMETLATPSLSWSFRKLQDATIRRDRRFQKHVEPGRRMAIIHDRQRNRRN